MRIGVNVGGTKIEVALMDSDDDMVFTKRIATPRDDYAATVGAITNIVEDMENRKIIFININCKDYCWIRHSRYGFTRKRKGQKRPQFAV